MRKRVYISGPLTLGNRNLNLFQAFEAHRQLIKAGFAPLNPMITMLCPFAPDVEHSEWLDCDLPWVEVCDVVVRLPGESKGADLETAHARLHGIPVFEITDQRHLEWAIADGVLSWLATYRVICSA